VKDLKLLHLLLCILGKHLITGLGLLFLHPFGLVIRMTMVAKMVMTTIKMIIIVTMAIE
jgi:hypothetical protein